MHRQLRAPKWDLLRWADDVDAPLVVRGASSGFTVLLLGGLAMPLAVTFVPVVGRGWLPFVALLAFVVSALHVGSARLPWLHGLASAVSSYLLVLPLVVFGGAADPGQIGLTLLSAVAMGSATGFVSGRHRNR